MADGGTGISNPKVTLQIIPAQQLSTVTEQKVLIVGQMLTGTATAGQLVQEIGNAGQEDGLFGSTSMVAGMVRRFKQVNRVTQLDVLPLADGGSATDATAVCTVTGTATAAGRVTLTVGSAKDFKVNVDIPSGASETEAATAIVTAFANNVSKAPFTQASTAGAVTFTATNGGTHANDWTIAIEGSVAGLTFALTGWTGGATDPVLTDIFDAIGDIRYQTIVYPAVYGLAEVEDLLNDRFNSTNDVKDGVAIQVRKGTLAELKAYTSALNSQSLVIFGNRTLTGTTAIGTAIQEMPDVSASEIAALRSLRLTQDAPLGDILTTVAPLDQFGGTSIASLPYFNTLVPQHLPETAGTGWTQEESDELESSAVSVFGSNRAFNNVILGQVVTTYLTDEAGNTDDSFKFLNTIDTASVVREFFFANLKSRYAQTRLTDGDVLPRRDMANAITIRGFCNQLYDLLAEQGLVQLGTPAKTDFNDNLAITINVRTGTATINMAPLLVGQLRVVLGTVQINFGG